MSAVPALAELRKACLEVLVSEVRPMHYGELTRLALARLGVRLDQADFRKAAEDVREKWLAAPGGPALYIGAPHCLAVLREWLTGSMLLNPDVEGERIYLDLPIVLGAMREAMLRFPYLLNKDGATPILRADRVARGYLIEKAVAQWARQRWPGAYHAPENEGRYAQPCDHDFRLWLPKSRRYLKVDVAGPGRDGLFGVTRSGKPRAEVHLVATLEQFCVRLIGVQSSDSFQLGRISATETQPLSLFIFLLNCEMSGYTVDEINRLAQSGPHAADAA